MLGEGRPYLGTYPRVCGGNQGAHAYQLPAANLSPRVRGKHPRLYQRGGMVQPIPACAGETRPPTTAPGRSATYPRVCGGNECVILTRGPVNNLSPRVRGKRRILRILRAKMQPIPACAGETVSKNPAQKAARTYPRVCGGNHFRAHRRPPAANLSPRVRGKHTPTGPRAGADEPIPACAGETGAGKGGAGFDPTYPRVCGGNAGRLAAAIESGNLSPRVRGKQFFLLGLRRAAEPIPACAGETQSPAKPRG